MDIDAYFSRIGYSGPRTATLDVLHELHALHPAAIPFEAFDVLLDRTIDLKPAAIDDKLIARKRGGYCFEQNSLFKRVLVALGFKVDGLIGRVRWMQADDAPLRARTHMTLRVAVGDQLWLADVGFGGLVLPAPLRIDTTAVQSTAHESFRLSPLPHGFRLEAQIGDVWEKVYDQSAEPLIDADYEQANWFSSKFPTSHFRHDLMVARTTPQMRYSLLNNRLSLRSADGQFERRTLNAIELEQALADLFKLPIENEWRPLLQRIAEREPV
ncbi:MAG: N-hydroxyarylamine O-acetyltransferase [Verrucomicrobiaceae bacterium]|nr:N-hydroxyarylamine O-acetyltransferase [Verrucomicrobiaceae bacterium]